MLRILAGDGATLFRDLAEKYRPEIVNVDQRCRDDRLSSVDDDPPTTRQQPRPCPVQGLPIYYVTKNLLGKI